MNTNPLNIGLSIVIAAVALTLAMPMQIQDSKVDGIKIDAVTQEQIENPDADIQISHTSAGYVVKNVTSNGKVVPEDQINVKTGMPVAQVYLTCNHEKYHYKEQHSLQPIVDEQFTSSKEYEDLTRSQKQQVIEEYNKEGGIKQEEELSADQHEFTYDKTCLEYTVNQLKYKAGIKQQAKNTSKVQVIQ